MLQYNLENYLNQLLEISRFRDYCPNGLQVEGHKQINTLISGVTASLELIEVAIASNADGILVHHGYFWKGEDPCIRGMKHQRLSLLLEHGINLFAYHLPLDAHLEFGNNIQLARRLGLQYDGLFGEQAIAMHGQLANCMMLRDFGKVIATALNREPLIIGDLSQKVQRIAWCTGAAQGCFEEAIHAQVDAFLTGEISEQNVHMARESGVAFIAAGHHATERYGVQALGMHIAERFGINHEFIDLMNPV
ncbi:MAG: Nif3-like dinuclear metal center hexameric protein [Nitrosomonas sp.]|jgi:dinuclear metal center YbgI/SA1388 family protein|nr:Nif3-like dinuclear metal center hexameric protein [Nitrosomonas sp.]MBK7365332.1 Nif3-like dinuclear metal center hexameric protein [Nitrosomonas sp.]